MQHCPSVCRCFRGICSTLTRRCENTITQSPGKRCSVTLYLLWVKANVQTTSLSIHPSIYLSHIIFSEWMRSFFTQQTAHLFLEAIWLLFMARTCFQTSKANENLISESWDSHWRSSHETQERFLVLNRNLLFCLSSHQYVKLSHRIQTHFCL